MAEARADAMAYLERTGNADLLPVLGLVADPIADQMRRLKAKAEMGNRAAPKRGG